MSRKHEISFAESAVQELEAIRTWYADRQVPEVGARLLEEIFSAVARLADFPKSGRIVPEFGIVDIRETINPPFRIVYRMDKSSVRIVRVWRSERALKMP